MAKDLQILSSDGTPGETFELKDAWLELRRGGQAVHDSVVAFLAARRAGTASTKTRAMVRGGGAKPYSQKGTGRARAGSIRSPLWRGGGVIFGPHPRDFSKRINRKVRALALKRAFSERVEAGDVLVVEDISLDEPRTRLLTGLLSRIGAGQNALVVVDEVADNVRLAARNLPDVDVMQQSSVNAYWTLLFRKIVFTRAGLQGFLERLPVREKAG